MARKRRVGRPRVNRAIPAPSMSLEQWLSLPLGSPIQWRLDYKTQYFYWGYFQGVDNDGNIVLHSWKGNPNNEKGNRLYTVKLYNASCPWTTGRAGKGVDVDYEN